MWPDPQFVAAAPLVADAEKFKRYYRELSNRLHPDRGGNTETFATINAAADVLKKHHGI